jgi:hypothetical protein
VWQDPPDGTSVELPGREAKFAADVDGDKPMLRDFRADLVLGQVEEPRDASERPRVSRRGEPSLDLVQAEFPSVNLTLCLGEGLFGEYAELDERRPLIVVGRVVGSDGLKRLDQSYEPVQQVGAISAEATKSFGKAPDAVGV